MSGTPKNGGKRTNVRLENVKPISKKSAAVTHDMPLFQIIPAKRVYCYQIAWQLPNEQREAMISLGLRPFRFTAQAGLELL